MTICKRAHRGIIRARAQHFIVNGKTWDNHDIPQRFWWAEGHPEIATAVETKMARPGLLAKKLGDELIIDAERYRNYPGCRMLFCLVYDSKALVSNPRGLESDLSGPRDKLAVRVMIVPK